ncbi:MAG TPA: acyltransferase [Mucilaginibacter sp.]|nr:acyltransferase [Mucilaginibacter sp.]
MLQKIKSLCYFIFLYPYYKIILGSLGSRSKIISPLKIDGASNISIGKKVSIGYKTWLASVPHTGSPRCSLVIEDGTYIGNFNHIYATSGIRIGKKVLTADKVYISDNLHSYGDINTAIIDQEIKQIQEVTIGDGSWLGENACIIGANIGKGCVVGANAVVTKNIPDYCVVIGIPARIIKRFDMDTGQWVRTTTDGEFISE